MVRELSKEYYVRPLDESDVDGPYPDWFNDQEVCRYNSHGKFPKTRAYFRDYVSRSNGEDRVVWAICHAVDGHIGNVSLQEISVIARTAEFAIVIGDRRHRAKGVGLLSGRELLRHGFESLNLERIYCGTAATNVGMRRLADKLGMALEGTRRQHLGSIRVSQ